MPSCSPDGFVPLWIRQRELSFLNYPRETGRAHYLLAIKENSNFCTLGEAGRYICDKFVELYTSYLTFHLLS